MQGLDEHQPVFANLHATNIMFTKLIMFQSNLYLYRWRFREFPIPKQC